MQIFLSWSGELSRAVAELFQDWLPNVIQDCNEFFISTEIAKGTEWYSNISENLRSSEVGIAFITAENASTPWLNYEAGALLARFREDQSKLIPVLINLKNSDYDGPMANLQLTNLTEDKDIRGLVLDIARHVNSPAQESTIGRAFEVFLPDFKNRLQKLVKESPTELPAPRRTVEQKLDEILELVRSTSGPVQGITRREERARFAASQTLDVPDDASPSDRLRVATKRMEQVLSAYAIDALIADGAYMTLMIDVMTPGIPGDVWDKCQVALQEIADKYGVSFEFAPDGPF